MVIVLKEKDHIQWLISFLLTETFLILITARVINFYHEQANTSDVLITIFAVINFVIAFLIIRLLLQTEFVFKELNIKENSILTMEETLRIIRSERHDFINHLQVICGLIADGNHHTVGEYIKDIRNNCLFNSKILNVSNPILRVLLQSIKERAESKGVYFNLEIQSKLENFYIKSADIATVFNNILENALENALEKVNFQDNEIPKAINFTISETEKTYCFYTNDSGPALNDEIVHKIYLEGFSTKGDGRGYGLTLVKKIIKKYGGKVFYDQESRGFWVILPKREV